LMSFWHVPRRRWNPLAVVVVSPRLSEVVPVA